MLNKGTAVRENNSEGGEPASDRAGEGGLAGEKTFQLKSEHWTRMPGTARAKALRSELREGLEALRGEQRDWRW